MIWGENELCRVEFFVADDKNPKQGGNGLIFSPDRTSFSISDSIYSLYPTASFELEDDKGIYLPFMMYLNGFPFTINFHKDEKNPNFCQYVTCNGHLQPTSQRNNTISFDLVHRMFRDQTTRSKTYDGTPSEVVKKVMTDNYSTTIPKLDINDSDNVDYWYQPLITDSQFLMDVLLPNVFSVASGGTPFFCYITTDNVFHFRNLKSLFEKPTGLEFPANRMFVVDGGRKGQGYMEVTKEQAGKDEFGVPDECRVFNIERVPTPWSGYFQKMKEDNYIYNWNAESTSDNRDQQVSVNLENVLRYNATAGAHYLPQWYGKNTNLTSASTEFSARNGRSNKAVMGLQGAKKITISGNLAGQQIQEMRDCVFIEKFIFTVKFSPHIHAGDLIILAFRDDLEESGFSRALGDAYFVIMSEHVWTREESMNAYTKLVVGRSTINIPKQDDQEKMNRLTYMEDIIV